MYGKLRGHSGVSGSGKTFELSRSRTRSAKHNNAISGHKILLLALHDVTFATAQVT